KETSLTVFVKPARDAPVTIVAAIRRSLMSSTRAQPKAASAEMSPVPLTIEGYSVMHQMMRFRWAAWRQLPATDKQTIVEEVAGVLARMEQSGGGQSALYSLLGHKGDLMFV